MNSLNLLGKRLYISVITVIFGSLCQAALGQVLFTDELDNASQLAVTVGNFGVNLDFGPPYTHFGVNDGLGGGDYGGDTPSARVNYVGFSGGYLEAYGLASLTNPSVVEWQNIDITGATNLYFSADFASALQPDNLDSVTVEAIIDGGTPEQILYFTSATNNGTFQVDGTGASLTATAQNFDVPITGTGTSLTIRMTLSLSASTSTGDDIAVDNVVVGQYEVVTASTVLGDGTITPLTQNILFDGTASFTVTPDIGWSVLSVDGDNCTPILVAGDNWEATNIQADCEVEASFVQDTYTIGGTVSGLAAGRSLTLQNNAADDLPITVNGGFTFSTLQTYGTPYLVTVLTQPEDQFCSVNNAGGTMMEESVVDVEVTCVDIELSLSTDLLQFSGVVTGEIGEELLTITNNGPGSVEIEEFIAPTSPFGFGTSTCAPLPLTLAPGESCELQITFSPTLMGQFNDELWIVSNAASSPNRVGINARAFRGPVPLPTLSMPAFLLMMLMMVLLAWRQTKKISADGAQQ